MSYNSEELIDKQNSLLAMFLLSSLLKDQGKYYLELIDLNTIRLSDNCLF